MNKDITEGNWRQLSGRVKERWGELTDQEVEEIRGRRESFTGKLQEKYGMKKDEAEKEWDRLVEERPKADPD